MLQYDPTKPDQDISCSCCGSKEPAVQVEEVTYHLVNGGNIIFNPLNGKPLFYCTNCGHVGEIRPLIF